MLLTKENLNANKVIYKKLDECDIYIVEKDKEHYIIGVYEGANTIYAKITPSFPSEWNCQNIIYFPFGYFVFAKDEHEMIDKINKKIEELRKNVLG